MMMATLTEQLDRIGAIAAAATPGPVTAHEFRNLEGEPDWGVALASHPQDWDLSEDMTREQAVAVASILSTNAAYRRFARAVAVGSRASPSNVIDNIDRALATLATDLAVAMGDEEGK